MKTWTADEVLACAKRMKLYGHDIANNILTDYAERIKAGESAICTCPSGDGSLRWPCPKHPPTQPSTSQAEVRGVERFGHHPDPAIDFCAEVESLLGEIENRRIGFENGTPTQAELDLRIERAMKFRVGGDENAIRAKQQLRDATTAKPELQSGDEPQGWRQTLLAVLSALDIATGDSDPNIDPDMTDDDVRDEYPAVWAMQQLSDLLATVPAEPAQAAQGNNVEAFIEVAMSNVCSACGESMCADPSVCMATPVTVVNGKLQPAPSPAKESM